ncbi:MAG: formylglycine-generating enzyme family protein [Kiritimatiellae bacterium]|nr:formylglycine-generating enzyme family protein [Kiritimatiellia bacterium]
MKKTATNTARVTACLMAFLSLSAVAREPAIRDVVVRQRWPWSRLVDICYVLECEDGARMNVTVAGFNGTVPLNLPVASLSGDLDNVSRGARHIVWDPMKSAYTNEPLSGFRVELTPTDVPLYMIVDLTKGAGATNQIEYVYEAELVTNKWGSWERNPVTNNGTTVESIIWTGVTNDALYKTKTEKLALRRIPAGTFSMGGKAVKLTKDYYAGVFEVTQRQWMLITGNNSSYFTVDGTTRPVDNVSYDAIRGATNDAAGAIDWPATRFAVSPSSFLWKFREKTGLSGIDLPTEAQWEYASRAGTTTYYHDGLGGVPNSVSNAQIDVLGRYRWNGGYYWNGEIWTSATKTFGPTNGTAIVGSYRPNAWGLYDSHGNVFEWCLDWYGSLSEGSDPPGVAAGSNRVRRGGSYYDETFWNFSSSRNSVVPSTGGSSMGLRLVNALP